MTNISTKEFLKLFPKANLNIENRNIDSTLKRFIIKFNHKLDKSWQTVGKYLRIFFKEQELELKGKNNMDYLYWETRGWDNPKQIVSNEVAKNFSKVSSKFYETRGFSSDEAKVKAERFYYDKIKGKRLLPTQLNYYIQKGQSPEEAKYSLKVEQTKRSAKLVAKEKVKPELKRERLWNHIEYWLSKGYSEEQSYQLMSEKFKERNLQTFKNLVEKNISKGMNKTQATEQATKHYKSKAKKTMQTRIKNKSFGWYKASKQSLDFFKPLMDYLDEENIEYYVGDDEHQEYFIAKGSDYFYSYDFCIPSKKIIFEYNGEHVHPNPKMTVEEWKNWKHCWTKENADECRKKEDRKIKVAEERGFTVIEIYESDEISSIELISKS